MSDNQEENPVVSGVIALLAVAVVVGLLGGLGAVVATKVVGLGDAQDAAADSTGDGGNRLIMPDPVPTKAASGPLVTLAVTQTPDPKSSESATAEPSAEETEEKKEKESKEIVLSQGASEVSPGEKLYLSGLYESGEGAVLDIEYRLDGGPWTDFPVDATVTNRTFSTYVETYRTGAMEWRMVDSSNGKKSNVVKVRHG